MEPSRKAFRLHAEPTGYQQLFIGQRDRTGALSDRRQSDQEFGQPLRSGSRLQFFNLIDEPAKM